ncbi:hypothetical protein CSUB01_07948 [Colletotrichum sublineola]|uniref:Aminoglycoside phosphotransferase domain-containing protein n=1 Tax=Colletotrichum sublineola TaxID=1173701 RepID=A0A066XMR3_COLSU|nr:hypothetical protein CSUB01_07948 [Colletotrichum sublineola]
MSAEQRDLVPDEKTLNAIFQCVDVEPKVISSTFETCTFSIHTQTPLLPGHPTDLLVRLETSGHHLHQVAALQSLARVQLPDLVPLVVSHGTTKMGGGMEVDYMVSEYVTGTTTLEAVWDTLGSIDQERLMDLVVRAVKRLQTRVRNIQEVGTQPDNAKVGGPKLGYFQDMEQFLDGKLQSSDSDPFHCRLLNVDGGILLESDFQDIGQVELTRADLDELKHHTVFCHNDLEPRNILVRPSTNSKGLSYDLAAIVDWEMAGFYPFAFEYGLKDNILGSSNLLFSWYSLFKERTAHLLPPNECHTKLVRALWVIDQSQKRDKTRNVGVRFQQMWIERLELQRSSHIRQGWVRKDGAETPVIFTKEDQEKLELEVLKELGYY